MPISNIKKINITILLMMLSVSGASEAKELVIKTLDTKGRTISPEVVRWWLTDNPTNKNTLVCSRDNCSRITIPANSASPVTVYALASLVKENDKACWDLYEGKAETDVSQQQITLTLSYTETVCK